jgi:ribosomal-protein-alanine N-acetyltransferase
VSVPVVLVRPATPDDIDAVADLETGTLGAEAWSYGLVAEGIRGNLPTVQYLLAEVGGRPVGHAVASLAGDVAELQRIGVTGTARRTGVAGALLDEVLVLARRSGADRLLLEVREDNAGALAFYAARGFVEIDRRRRYYQDGAAAVVMRIGLRKGC